jgi:hypothetical protein
LQPLPLPSIVCSSATNADQRSSSPGSNNDTRIHGHHVIVDVFNFVLLGTLVLRNLKFVVGTFGETKILLNMSVRKLIFCCFFIWWVLRRGNRYVI